MEAAERLRSVPKVDRVLQEESLRSLLLRLPRDLVVSVVQDEVGRFRERLLQAGDGAPPDRDAARQSVADAARRHLENLLRPSLQPVINATGVVLHTNLGRAILGDAAVAALVAAARGFVNLEVDLHSGMRCSRQVHLQELLCRLTGAEAALTVNNNAAALLLAIDTWGGAGVVVSRGEQVEIGDSFRLPDILAKSGVPIHEVGTTNRTTPEDYEAAARQPGCVLLKVHRSNFTVQGFTRDTSVGELVEVAKRRGAMVVYDLGSGCLESWAEHGLSGEPDVQSALRHGAHVVTMSGDKLLGGPQAGILAGTQEAIEAMRKNPLARAFRVDKLTLAALQATLLSYARDGARDVPTRRLILSEPDTIRARAQRILEALQACPHVDMELAPGEASVGGGSYADVSLPSFEVRLRPHRVRATDLLTTLRQGTPAVLARIQDAVVSLDARCVGDHEVEPLARAVRAALAARGAGA